MAEDSVGEAGASGPAPGGPDSGLAVVALALARKGRVASDRLDALLEKQGRLLDLQIENLNDDRALQHRHAALRYFGDRLRIGLQMLAIAFGLFVIAGVAAMAWSAHEDHGLVVEAFAVPPDLAQKGLTGQVVARRLLDRLADLQSQTDTMRAAGSYRNNWGNDLKVEIPQTGVSIGELRGYLRDWLGDETHISGEVWRTASGLTLTARAGEQARSFTGREGDFDTLVDEAAEAVYGRTQPYRYAVYLLRQNRWPEARKILADLATSPDPLERAWGHALLGFHAGRTGDDAEDAREQRAALREVPGFAPALKDLEGAEFGLGHDEEALRATREYLAAGRSIRRHIAPDEVGEATEGLLWTGDDLVGDYLGSITRASRLLASPQETIQSWGRHAVAVNLALDHDLPAARAAANALAPDDPYRYAVPGLAALELGDPSAVALLSRAASGAATSDFALFEPTSRFLSPWLALAKARGGDFAGAEAVIAATPLDCYLCVRARGLIAATRGDRPSADRWFAEAIRQGPDLPQAFTDRGAARLAWGDVDGAIADARRANAAGPRNADALKLWGDALAARRAWREALAKYDAALPLAPAWTALRRARATAARKV